MDLSRLSGFLRINQRVPLRTFLPSGPSASRCRSRRKGVGRVQAFPKGNQGIGAFVLADKYHGSGVEIEHDVSRKVYPNRVRERGES